jgi:hypothetical protein
LFHRVVLVVDVLFSLHQGEANRNSRRLAR